MLGILGCLSFRFFFASLLFSTYTCKLSRHELPKLLLIHKLEAFLSLSSHRRHCETANESIIPAVRSFTSPYVCPLFSVRWGWKYRCRRDLFSVFGEAAVYDEEVNSVEFYEEACIERRCNTVPAGSFNDVTVQPQQSMSKGWRSVKSNKDGNSISPHNDSFDSPCLWHI